MKSVLFVVGFSFLVLTSGCTEGVPTVPKSLETATDVISGFFPLRSLDSVIVVKNAVGSLVTRWGGDEDTIRWTLNRQATGNSQNDARVLLNLIVLIQEFGGDTTRFYAQTPTNITGYSFSTDVTMGVPFKRLPVVIDGVLGSTSVADIDTTLTLRNVHGVTVRRVRGSCTISSLSGGVDCEIAIPSGGTCSIVAEKGDIILKIPTNTSANVVATTANGTVAQSGLAFVTLTQQSKSLTGRLADGSGQIRVETANGNIILQGVIP